MSDVSRAPVSRRANTMSWVLGCWSSIAGILLWSSVAHSLDIFGALGVFFLMVVAAPICMGVLFGNYLTRSPRLSRYAGAPSGRVIVYTAVGCVVLALASSVGFSKYYWGYWFFRPDISRELKDADKIMSFGALQSIEAKEPGAVRLGMRRAALPDLVKLHDKYNYDVPWGRAPAYLFHKGKLSAEVPEPNEALIHQIESMLSQRVLPFIETGTGVYEQTSRTFRGGVIEFASSSGVNLVHVTLGGGQVSNDHYTYYELLFSPDASGKLGAPIDWKKFHYDIACIEGFEWMIVAPFLSIGLWLLLLPLSLLMRKRDHMGLPEGGGQLAVR